MSKHFFAIAFAIGLATIGWVGFGFAGASWLALAVTAAIGGVYLLGAFELAQFRTATDGLARALDDTPQPPPSLRDWLANVPPALRHSVRLRIEGERGSLPGPALTPYLVGLLVMLGMLGTFLGMVVTFRGAVFALQGSTDLETIRSALAAPLKGLGLSFGTSVAGVAASAMLGLMSAIARRERIEIARRLDTRTAGVLQPFSLVHQRQEAFRALQVQADALPRVVDRLEAMMERIERRNEQLDAQLAQRQAQFHSEATLAYTELARSVGASLRDCVAASAQAAGESIRPVVESAMTQIVHEAQRTNERITGVATAQVEALSQQFGATARTVSESWTAALAEHVRHSEAVTGGLQAALASFTQTFEQRSAALLGAVEERLAAAEAALRQGESERGAAAVARLGELQASVAQHLAALGTALEAPITRLLHTAAEVPQAAAGVIAQLREEMGRLAQRDNVALQERTMLLERLGSLLDAIGAAAGEQRAASQAMVASASSVMEQAGLQFAQALQAQAGGAADASAHIAGSAVELSALTEAFSHSVQSFQASNDKLTETLQRIEGSLTRSTARSDEQLAYYVAQAREVIDLSIASQHGLVEHLRQLASKPARPIVVADGTR